MPQKQSYPLYFYDLCPDSLPKGIINITFEEVDVPIARDFHAGMPQEFGDNFYFHPRA